MDMAVTVYCVYLHVVYMPFLFYIVNSLGPCLPRYQAMQGHFDHRLDSIAGMLEDAKHNRAFVHRFEAPPLASSVQDGGIGFITSDNTLCAVTQAGAF